MQAIIMAGGKGTRLISITKDEIPKPMALINGKPIIEWQINCLRKEGITDIILVIGHRGEKIEKYFNDGSQFGVKISYYKETLPLGSAGAIAVLKEQLEKDFFLVFGDVLFDVNLGRMFCYHQEKKAKATLLVHPNSHPHDSDIVLKDNLNRILGFAPKNEKRFGWYDNCVNAGIYVLNKDVCKKISAGEKCDLEKNLLLPLIEGKDMVFAYESPEYIKDVGTPDRLNLATIDLKNGIVESKNLRNVQKCIFIDRDGTINRYKGLIDNEDKLELEEQVTAAIRLINHSRYLAIVITNQPVVARGMCSIEDVERIHKKLKTLLGMEGAYLDDILFCPHHPDKGYPEENVQYKVQCDCRKPNIGLFKYCAEKYNINLADSWMIGDTSTDIQAGINAGMYTALVLTGEAGKDYKFNVQADLQGKNLFDAINQIIKEDK